MIEGVGNGREDRQNGEGRRRGSNGKPAEGLVSSSSDQRGPPGARIYEEERG